MARTPAQRTGDAAEERALTHLRRQGGHRTVTRNFRAKGGEIDLITLEGEVLVFTEVRARADSGFGRPEETVGPRKQRRLIQAARAFLATHPEHAARFCRFDVVAVDGRDLRWIPDAFRLDATWS
ncbi:hypothetical protein AN478_04590 [Thiohalorhabdus denitrificans]|uniref:UPF0102 protein SAMN05661077_1857 n=1 Tax=Thiohalorhabdus denitrificans TaxID=381306 RepID=A0A0P9CPZ3_9GAMM|nr:YraN family protein [Thiohalorhabdus denitrificans]KPV41176.1 hypothetical protein AN478_04590 [Thiohalorhabdus denitrificans]SCY35619.1 putative endonuclease [Thiohalorhabdus denitrificans]